MKKFKVYCGDSNQYFRYGRRYNEEGLYSVFQKAFEEVLLKEHLQPALIELHEKFLPGLILEDEQSGALFAVKIKPILEEIHERSTQPSQE